MFGIKVKHYLFRVTLLIKKPKQCLNCQRFGYFASDCKNPLNVINVDMITLKRTKNVQLRLLSALLVEEIIVAIAWCVRSLRSTSAFEGPQED